MELESSVGPFSFEYKTVFRESLRLDERPMLRPLSTRRWDFAGPLVEWSEQASIVRCSGLLQGSAELTRTFDAHSRTAELPIPLVLSNSSTHLQEHASFRA